MFSKINNLRIQVCLVPIKYQTNLYSMLANAEKHYKQSLRPSSVSSWNLSRAKMLLGKVSRELNRRKKKTLVLYRKRK
jgi:hypothetical protein